MINIKILYFLTQSSDALSYTDVNENEEVDDCCASEIIDKGECSGQLNYEVRDIFVSFLFLIWP